MIRVDEIKRRLDFLANKEMSGGYSLPDFNSALRMANEDLMLLSYGHPSQSRPGTIQYEVTQKIKDDLRPFKASASIPRNENGVFPIPEDYVHVTGQLSTIINNCSGEEAIGRSVDMVTDSQLGRRLNDSLTKPTEKHPIMVTSSDHFEVWPESISSIKITYIRKPVDPVYAVTLDDNDIEQFDEESSVNLEWPSIMTNDITRLVASYVGLAIKDSDLYTYGESTRQAGS